MLDDPYSDNLRSVQVRLRKRLDRYAIAACAVIALILIIFSTSLYSFRSTLSTVQTLLAHTAPLHLAGETSLDQIANRTLGVSRHTRR